MKRIGSQTKHAMQITI